MSGSVEEALEAKWSELHAVEVWLAKLEIKADHADRIALAETLTAIRTHYVKTAREEKPAEPEKDLRVRDSVEIEQDRTVPDEATAIIFQMTGSRLHMVSLFMKGGVETDADESAYPVHLQAALFCAQAVSQHVQAEEVPSEDTEAAD